MVVALLRKIRIVLRPDANWSEFARVVEGWVSNTVASPFAYGELTLPSGPERSFLSEASKGNMNTIWLQTTDESMSRSDVIAGINDYVPRRLGSAQRIIESIDVFDV